MNNQKHRWVFYLITATIIVTILVQFYWNYKNYEENKQRVTNEIQISLDNALEEYFSTIAKNNFITILKTDGGKSDTEFLKNIPFDSVFNSIKPKNTKPKFQINSIELSTDDKMDQKKVDSIFASITSKVVNDKELGLPKNSISSKIKYFKGKKASDSLKLIKKLQPVFISMSTNSIKYDQLDSLFINQLNKKNIAINHSLNHFKNDTIFFMSSDSLLKDKFITISSNSTYLKENEKLKLLFNNPNLEALKRSSTGIILSFLLSLIIIFSLFYLLKIINKQKELAEIKNDLISNITHEFKTPIATVSTAIEAIESFNAIDDKEKTKKYLAMSSVQLTKLHQMVEKLLETATLDSEQLLLKKESSNIVELIDKLTQKHQHLTTKKKINFSTNTDINYINIDVFHFENAISNLIDNAIKYGGDIIEVNINTVLNNLEITIADNGTGIEKNFQEKIFDKFYRIPKGNTHDVKGFGIGLYYSKKIIEKHKGIIQLSSNSKSTIFKITLPNE